MSVNPFNDEIEFEKALVSVLTNYGWEKEILKNRTEKQLIDNWSRILFENNRGIDRLGDYPLTDGEMGQIIEQINALRTPLNLNGFINGKTVSITRDNLDDAYHFGKEVSLKIYDRHEIAAGQSRYQIAEQTIFTSKSKILNNRRGDLLLLINGMPVINIELKKSGVSFSQACNQIEKYEHEGIFTGLFALVQVFVAMNPENTVYFANPGPDGKFDSNYYFHWADFNNEPINDWKNIASSLLSIPMAHQLIGFYTVADDTDGILKVLRSYQYYAANAISDKVAKTKWNDPNPLGGYIWHTTGSGKTMTSFKSAQLIANSNDADKVIFLMDRIELGTQSLKEYRGFADDNEDIQATENTIALITKLKSSSPADTLIVTSIQKMSNIKDEDGGLNAYDIKKIRAKRLVFIVDECHRSTFGEMLITIKETFPGAIFFGFTGTPIQDENQKKMNTTATVFGDELHRYSIADGIRDRNVLGFDPYKVLTFKDKDVRCAVALEKAKALTETEAIADPIKNRMFYEYMDSKKIPMTGRIGFDGKYNKGIEDYLSNAQYRAQEHQNKVVEDIIENWVTLSHDSKFHALFATNSISEAITYYRLIKKIKPELKVTALFDPNIDNNGGVQFKEDGLVEIIEDYNARYKQDFSLPTYAKLKKDISARLAHKKPYTTIEKNPEKQIELLIVVDQMLTGFDSKWINTLYLDKMLRDESIIQAFSRTNRLFGPEKPFGTIRYYRRPHTMEKYIEKAVKLYSGDKALGLFACKLQKNLEAMNIIYQDIADLFKNAGIESFEKLPDDYSERRKFASLFKEFNDYLEAAKIQGFKWSKLEYEFVNDEEPFPVLVPIKLAESEYLTLVLRYKELLNNTCGGSSSDEPFDLVGYLTGIDTGVIDADYMNSRFDKYLKLLNQSGTSGELLEQAKNDLHKTFATLTQEEQKYANILLHDIERGDIVIEENRTFRDYIFEYLSKARSGQIYKANYFFGVDELKLKKLMDMKVGAENINEFGRFDDLIATVDKVKAKDYFEKIENDNIPQYKANMKVNELLREFIVRDGFDIVNPEDEEEKKV